LFVAIIVFVIVTRLSSPPVRTAKPTLPAPQLTAVPTPVAPSVSPTAVGSGPFGQARAGFLAVIVGSPTSMSTAPLPGTPATAEPVSPPATPTTIQAQAAVAMPAPPPPQPQAAPAAQPAPQAAARRAPASSPSTDPTAQGQLTVVCFPACDQVVDNGKSLGPSPIFKRSVNVGVHRLRLVSGNASKTISASVIVDQLTTIKESIQP
jgi:hypothetical protein